MTDKRLILCIRIALAEHHAMMELGSGGTRVLREAENMRNGLAALPPDPVPAAYTPGVDFQFVTNPMDAVNAQREKEAAAKAEDDRAKKAHEASLRVYGLSDDGWRWRQLSETDKNAWRAVARALDED